jgi:hypothetical protein
MESDGTVKAEQKISETQGGFTGSLYTNAVFGADMGSLGDLDGDSLPDLAVGNYGDDDGGLDRGAVWVLFLNSDGTVGSHQKISDTQGGFGGTLSNSDLFGHSVVNVGDLDGDGVTDLAVGATFDDDGGPDRGAVWILFMNPDGTVKSEQKISATQGGFSGVLANGDQFGESVANLGDLDGDGVTDLAVGASEDDDGGPSRGAVWILFMNPDGTVKSEQKISATQGGFMGALDDYDNFGWSVGDLGDVDADGVRDLAVGARYDDDGGTGRGAVWILFLNSDGTVKSEQKISSLEGGFAGALDDGDYFGTSVVSMGDLDGDGGIDLAVGASHDDDGGSMKGAVWILFMTNLDLDGDGIHDDVDDDPLVYSTRFSDFALGGITSGRILGVDAGITLQILDAPDPLEGVKALVWGPAGAKARIKIDGSKGTYSLTPGEYILTTGASVILEVLQGDAAVRFIVDGTLVVVDVQGTVVFDEVIADDQLLELLAR